MILVFFFVPPETTVHHCAYLPVLPHVGELVALFDAQQQFMQVFVITVVVHALTEKAPKLFADARVFLYLAKADTQVPLTYVN